MVAGAETIGGRLHGPVDVAAHQVEEFPAHHGDLGLVDAVGAEDRTAPAFGALVEVVKPLLQNVFGQVARSGQAAERLSRIGKIAAVNRTQQLGPKNRHVFGVPGADVEMALVGAGPAADADVQEEAEGPEFIQPFLEPVQDDLFPVRGQFPVGVRHLPLPGIGHS